MSLAALSVAALVLAILVSCVTSMNVGVLAIALAWVLGVYAGHLPVAAVMSGFPSQLLLTLGGVTLLFTIAQLNGTLDRVAHHAVRSCRGSRGALPVMFFVLAAGLASMGPGNIATAAIVAPMAMTTAARVRIPMFLMAIMVGNGANAGSLSPFAPTGIIVNGIMSRIGMPGHEWQTYAYNLLAHAGVAFAGYFAFGGWKLFAARGVAQAEGGSAGDGAIEPRHWMTLAVIAALIIAVVTVDVNIGMGAFAGAVLLVLLRCADDREAIKRMPWNVIMMVCGVTVLIALLERSAGIDLIVSWLSRIATTSTVTPEIAFVTGLVSVYSSTSGVVLPAFLPMVPRLTSALGLDSFALASAINVSAHLVDVSPLSTIGALCLAGVPGGQDAGLFNRMLAWGLSMTVVGAVLCYLAFGPRA
jgi:di/tricarboxylate transporter